MDDRSRWQRLVTFLLPWYDTKVERQRDQHTEDLRQRSIAARISAERIRKDYAAAGRRMER